MFEERRVPDRQVRAMRTETTVRVYLACSPADADAALGKQVFERGGATGFVPSFRVAAYLSGNGRKPEHERVLAVDITREGFERALLEHTEWVPERDLDHTALNFQAIRIVGELADEWITTITDVTPVMRDIAGLLATDQLHLAVKLVPHEPPYELQAG
ncbi:DUF4291 domain-containing protein [Amycolatopsis balhimycina DSM 5908]|uniref:DUF4291 domain-containing protein n=1 Tax=Amycolatopsis balhimycina DSM 5908 TaxID=1081091 RepID=A0A428X328_AMYBA|nr:DUF4291 family protein [Amycolatopsis balhimycina]RSM49699.1 DUF4291 domain-containing protein [Amycolatopsis balhimycina DSM 5908]